VPVGVLLLNRGGRLFKPELFQEYYRLGLTTVVSVENPSNVFDMESVAKNYPYVTFIMPHRRVTTGDLINIGIEEIHAQYVFVMWTDISIMPGGLPRSMEFDEDTTPPLCLVPSIFLDSREGMPTLSAPALEKNRLRVLLIKPESKEQLSLYPYDYCGIYSKERFLLLGGYDSHIRSAYWQKLDFGFRSYLWGERIVSMPGLRCGYSGTHEGEDVTPDTGYKRFFLKNLAIEFKGDAGILPWSRFFSYLPMNRLRLLSSYREFKEVRNWVEKNTYRYTRDARSVTELWETEEM